jgi:hypothetical protein
LAAEFEGGRKARENTEKPAAAKRFYALPHLFCTNRDIEKKQVLFSIAKNRFPWYRYCNAIIMRNDIKLHRIALNSTTTTCFWGQVFYDLS